MTRNNHYNKNLKRFARNHRNQSTKAEIRLWCELLRKRQMMGYPFLRQRPIANYIADFFCKELKLIIEADGISHSWEGAAEKDKRREEDLKALGYTILRFDDAEIMNNVEGVREAIEEWIRDRHPPAPF